MESIVIKLYVPAINRVFDVVMPSQLPICRYISNLASQISDISQTVSFDPDYTVLCATHNSVVLPMNKTLAECGIHDAYQLMLI